MLIKQDNPVNMILEQANLGRGRHWFVLFFKILDKKILNLFYYYTGMILLNYAVMMFKRYH